MKPRTHGCLALGTSGNSQGSTMCFDLDTRKVVTRRIVKELPYLDRVIKRVSEVHKTPRGEKYSDEIEFLNRKRQPFDWENEELAEALPEVEEPIYPDILAEVPGLVLETYFDDTGDAVRTSAPPTLAERAAAALSNAGISLSAGDDGQITGVDREITGVYNETCLRTVRRNTDS